MRGAGAKTRHDRLYGNLKRRPTSRSWGSTGANRQCQHSNMGFRGVACSSSFSGQSTTTLAARPRVVPGTKVASMAGPNLGSSPVDSWLEASHWVLARCSPEHWRLDRNSINNRCITIFQCVCNVACYWVVTLCRRTGKNYSWSPMALCRVGDRCGIFCDDDLHHRIWSNRNIYSRADCHTTGYDSARRH